jgi:hypothetical protein
MKKLIFAIGLMLAVLTAKSQHVSGTWSGVLKLGDRNLSIVFNVKKMGECYTTTLDSPTQNVKGFSTNSTTFVDSILTIRMDDAHMQYEGRLMKNNELHGIFTQMGIRYALNLTNAENPVVESVKKPVKRNFTAYSYYVDTVSITNKHLADAKAVLYQPIKTKKSAAIVLVCDFDKHGANENKEMKEFSDLSDYLCSNGFVVICLEKAAFENSTKEALNYLKLCSFVNANKVSVVKFNETSLRGSYFSQKNNTQINKEISMADSRIYDSFDQLTRWLIKIA